MTSVCVLRVQDAFGGAAYLHGRHCARLCVQRLRTSATAEFFLFCRPRLRVCKFAQPLHGFLRSDLAPFAFKTTVSDVCAFNTRSSSSVLSSMWCKLSAATL